MSQLPYREEGPRSLTKEEGCPQRWRLSLRLWPGQGRRGRVLRAGPHSAPAALYLPEGFEGPRGKCQVALGCGNEAQAVECSRKLSVTHDHIVRLRLSSEEPP